MTQLADALADIPLELRIELFESHIKPFGADITQKQTLGGKYIHKYNKNPNPNKYEVLKCDEYLKKKQYEVFISPIPTYVRPESPRPEVNDAHVKPFGGDLGGKMTLGGKPPAFPEKKKKGKKKK